MCLKRTCSICCAMPILKKQSSSAFQLLLLYMQMRGLYSRVVCQIQHMCMISIKSHACCFDS